MAANDVNVEGERASKNSGTKEVLCTGLPERSLHAQGGSRILCTHVNEPPACAHREGGNQHRLDDHVRIFLHQEAIDVCAGISLVAVGDDVLDCRVLVENRPPFPARGESRAAAAPQSGTLDLSDEALGRELERAWQRTIAAQRPIRTEGRGPAFDQSAEHYRLTRGDFHTRPIRVRRTRGSDMALPEAVHTSLLHGRGTPAVRIDVPGNETCEALTELRSVQRRAKVIKGDRLRSGFRRPWWTRHG